MNLKFDNVSLAQFSVFLKCVAMIMPAGSSTNDMVDVFLESGATWAADILDGDRPVTAADMLDMLGLLLEYYNGE